jgi:hypothetical protein
LSPATFSILLILFIAVISALIWRATRRRPTIIRVLLTLAWFPVLFLAASLLLHRGGTAVPPIGTSTPQAIVPPSILPEGTQVPSVDVERVEAEYPPQMYLGHADTVRVSLLYIAENEATPTIEISGNQGMRASPIAVGTPGPLSQGLGAGYHVFMIAHLNAPGFEVKPSADQEYRLSEKHRLDWVWDILPQKEGQQALSLTIDARWEPTDGGKPFTYPIYRQRLVTNVNVPVFSWGSPLQIYTILGAAAGALVTWALPRLYTRVTVLRTEQHGRSLTNNKSSRGNGSKGRRK